MGFLSTVFPFFNPLQTAQDVASGDFGGMGGDNTQTIVNAPWGPQQQYLLGGYGAAENMFFNPRGGFTGLGKAYPQGSYIAGFNPLQQQGQQSLVNAAGNMFGPVNNMTRAFNQGVNPLSNPLLTGTTGNIGQQQSTLSGLMNNNINYNPYAGAQIDLGANAGNALNSILSGQVNQNVYQPIVDATVRGAAEDFLDQVAPQLRTDAIVSGNYGTPKSADAYARAVDRMQENILNTTAGIGANAAEGALSRQYGGVNTAAGLAGQQADLTQQAGLTNAQNAMAAQIARGNLALDAAGQTADTAQGFLNPLLNYGGNMFSQAPTMANMMMQPGNIYNQVGAQQQALTQQQLNEQLQRYQMNRAAPAQDLGMYMDLIRGGPAYIEQSQTTPNNPLAALLGMGTVAGGFMMGGPAGGAAAMQAAPSIYQLAGGGYGQPGPWAGNYNYPGGM